MSGPRSPEPETPEEGLVSCEEAFERLYDFLDGELCATWTEKVRAHIEVCRKCYPHFNFERAFLDHVRSLGLEPEAREGLEARVREALREE